MHFMTAVIVCLGYFQTPVWGNGLNEDQIKVMMGLYADVRVSTEEDAEQKITQVIEESFGIEQLSNIFKYDSNEPDYVNLHHLLKALAYEENKNFERIQVKKLTNFEVEYYLYEFMAHAKFHEKRGYLTLKELLELFKNNSKLKDALNTISEDVQKKSETCVGGDYAINVAEFLLAVLKIKPEGNGLTLAQIEKFLSLYETGNINLVASQTFFNELDITSRECDLNLLFNINRPVENLLMDLILIAADHNRTVKGKGSRLLVPGEIAYFINEFKKLDRNHDGLLSEDEYSPIVVDLTFALKKIKKNGNVKDSVTFEKAQNILKKLYSADGISVKKAINILEYMEIQLFYKTNLKEDEEENS